MTPSGVTCLHVTLNAVTCLRRHLAVWPALTGPRNGHVAPSEEEPHLMQTQHQPFPNSEHSGKCTRNVVVESVAPPPCLSPEDHPVSGGLAQPVATSPVLCDYFMTASASFLFKDLFAGVPSVPPTNFSRGTKTKSRLLAVSEPEDSAGDIRQGGAPSVQQGGVSDEPQAARLALPPCRGHSQAARGSGRTRCAPRRRAAASRGGVVVARGRFKPCV